MNKILTEVYDFIKNPIDERIESWTFLKNVKYIFYVLFFEIILNGLIFIPLILLLDNFETLVADSRIDYSSNTLIFNLIVIGVIIPIVEEIVFRSGLRYNKLFSLIVTKNRWNFSFKYLVYFSILIFGILHATNFENCSRLFYFLIPILTLSQIAGGIFLTFLRVKFNLISSIISHILWNIIIVIVPLIFTFFEMPYEKKSDDYILEIQKLHYNTNNNQIFKIDSLSNKIMDIEITEYSINHILDSLFFDKREKEDQLLNINFKSKNGITKDELKILLLEFEKEELN